MRSHGCHNLSCSLLGIIKTYDFLQHFSLFPNTLGGGVKKITTVYNSVMCCSLPSTMIHARLHFLWKMTSIFNKVFRMTTVMHFFVLQHH